MPGFDIPRAQRRRSERESNTRSVALQPLPPESWPVGVNRGEQAKRTRAWRSRDYIVQEFIEAGGVVRLSINRTKLNGNRWLDGIAWEEIQAIKNELGFFAQCAVELYPPVLDEINVGNMRHIWLLEQPPAFMWRARRIGEVE